MRRAIALLAVLAWLLPVSARAQTATFAAGPDCSPNISVTNGGLTLQATVITGLDAYTCIANMPKYSGKWYFEFTVNAIPSTDFIAFEMGVSNNGSAQPANGGTTLAVSGYGSSSPNRASYTQVQGGTGNVSWGSISSATMGLMTVGQTGAVAVDLDSDPPQIWATPDVTGTGGYSGGPEWNGSTSASPLVAGTGIPTTGGTGLQFLLPGQAYFPVFVDGTQSGQTSGEATFNFGASAFAGTVPSGYSSWNSAGGDAPTPGPTHPMTINVANAPAWQASTAYVQGDRVVAGPAWNGSAFTSGEGLYLWALTGGYGGTSGSSAAAFTSCPSPANYGGGLVGTYPRQWLGATHVTDGALTWTCLTPVDYTSFTAMADDSTASWTANTVYHVNDYVLNGGNSYIQTAATANTCTSASSGGGPSGTAPTTTIADGTCSWLFQGTVPYSSEANRIPHETNYQVIGSGITEINLYWNTTVDLWYGGRGAAAYQNGANGESDPILLANHTDYPGEWTPNCYHGDVTTTAQVQLPNCAGAGTGWQTTIEPAPGDGFADSMARGRTPLGYPNAAYGVEFYSDSPFTNGNPIPGTALAVSDSEINLIGLQFLSTQGPAVTSASTGSTSMFTAGNGHGNSEYFDRDMLYAGGSLGAVTVDATSVIANSTIVYNGTAADCFGVWAKFNAAIVNDTFIGPGAGATNCTAIISYEGSAIGFTTAPIYSNAVFGWANPYVYGTAQGLPTTVSGNNATDLPSGYTPPANFQMPGNTSVTYAAAMLPGVSLFSLSAAAQFVNPAPGPGMDLRLLTTGSLYGGGAGFSFALGENSTQVLTNESQPDILGNNRPQGTRYDIGAYQVSLGCPSPAGAGCN